MTKTQAAQIFGNKAALARALNITPQAISRWPEQLDRAREDRVRGAMSRLRMPQPADVEQSV